MLALLIPLVAATASPDWNVHEWVGPPGGRWDVSTNWDDNVVPNGTTAVARFSRLDRSTIAQLPLGYSLELSRLEVLNPAAGLSWEFPHSPSLIISDALIMNGWMGVCGDVTLGSDVETVSIGGTMEMAASRRLWVYGEQIDVEIDGLLKLGDNASLAIMGEGVTVAGDGEIQLLAGTFGGKLNTSASHSVLGPDVRVRGSGAITGNWVIEGSVVSDALDDIKFEGVTNSGMIRATAGSSIITSHSGTVTNRGTFEAEGVGAFFSMSTGVVKNEGGLIRISNGADGWIRQVSGGVLRAEAGCEFKLDSAKLRDITLEGKFRPREAYDNVRIEGTVTCNGIIDLSELEGEQLETRLVLIDDAMLDGAGTLRLAGVLNERDMIEVPVGMHLEIGPDFKVVGSGDLTGSIRSRGFLLCESGMSLQGSFVNAGVIEVAEGAQLEVYGTFVQEPQGKVVVAQDAVVSIRTGATLAGGSFRGQGEVRTRTFCRATMRDVTCGVPVIAAQGTLLTLGGSVVIDSLLTVDGSHYIARTDLLLEEGTTLGGTGQVELTDEGKGSAIVVLNGTASIGAGVTLVGEGEVEGNLLLQGPFDPDLIRINGALTLGPTASWTIVMSDTSPFPRVHGSGQLLLNGALKIKLAEGYEPQLFDFVNLALCGNVAGEFDSVELPDLGDELAFRLVQQRTALQARVVCRPDWSADGLLDHSDVELFVQSYFNAQPDSDYNRDGQIDVHDLITYLRAFEVGCSH